MSFKTLAAAAALAAGTMFAASSSFALPITSGVLGMSGSYQHNGGAGGLSDATTIDFSPAGAGGNFLVLNATGSFGAGGLNLAFGDIGSIQDLTFSPFVGPIAAFFSIDGLTFDLESLSINTQNDTTLALVGTGTFTHDGDSTSGQWAFSSQVVGGTTELTFSWSADATPTVPEPGTLAVLGMGLLGLGLARRRMAKA